VRFVFEPNTDGYLYVFYAENGVEPRMIFPNERLSAGSNAITAHVPLEVPSSKEPDANLRWFVFDEKPAIERLFFVVTREPLTGVPTGQSLVAYARDYPNACPWKPAPEIWTSISTHLGTPMRRSEELLLGQVQTKIERDAIGRGFGLPPKAAEPSIVAMSTTPDARIFAITVDLVHR
jgi:hypothetical protein